MFAISRRAFTNINSNIEHSTFYATYQLALSIGWTLEVQASHDTIAAHRLIVLAEVNTVSQNWGNFLFKLSLAEALEEVATSITEEAWLYNENALYFCFYYVHVIFFFYITSLTLTSFIILCHKSLAMAMVGDIMKL
ncbi:hypothetical protein HMPREF0673_01973 [Leyella stercorea DSM 18206]|uniref:Uncharacterized protein n=1 Tax=Leyella stercorea DSM 18206 TaxID=1002367 RepID=G6AZA9_9BACT|nr:hypothetical protein HMPREF0673_01973 [Leyella stercorea DSM 18206]